MFDLVRDIRKKDKNAVTLLYNRYGKKLYGFAVSKWNLTEDEAWEIVYQTLYKIMDVADRYKFEEENNFIGFIYKVFVNNLRNYYNKNKKTKIETVELHEKYGSHTQENEVAEDTKPSG